MIRLRNVRVNNLKGIDLDIPNRQWLLFCGVSGSGKSSLAFDTLYAEGQRRYISCLSPQTRQFVTQLDKPDADLIEGIPPAIAVQASRHLVSRTTTVGTASELSEYLSLLMTELANAQCVDCQTPLVAHEPHSVSQWVEGLPSGLRLQIVFHQVEQDWATSLMVAQKDGFARAIVANKTIDLAHPGAAQLDESIDIDGVRVVVDRLKTGGLDRSRLVESLEIAFQYGGDQCEVMLMQPDPGSGVAVDIHSGVRGQPQSLDGKPWLRFPFSRQLICAQCQRTHEPPVPRRFSHTHRLGACPECQGVGFSDKLDRVVCESCQGSRFSPEALAFTIDGHTVADLGAKSIDSLLQILQSLFAELKSISNEKYQATHWVRQQIVHRLDYLQQVGLGYLSLSRGVRSVSTGEAQRIALTACLSSTLVNAMYVLDEPSVGLHAAEVSRLVDAIGALHERGNTVIVVDHDETLMRATPRIVEVGPAAGATGGEVVFDGTPEELEQHAETVTADFLAKRRGVSWNEENRRRPRGELRLVGARGNNLQSIDVSFPLGCLTVVSGVSGSGKSSLVQQTLYGAVCQRKQLETDPPLPYDDVFGDSQFDEIVLVDRTAIGRSARSNPVTYVKAFDDIRRCFSETIDAKTRNLNVSKFSFNASGGRCDKCEGAGCLVIDMQFMPEVTIQCDACRGTRYREEVLSVKYRGKNIADVLKMTVREAFLFFRGQPKVQAKLKALIDVGLDYIQLGQPANTLSSGESQRLKLGMYLNSAKSKRALFLMDEPTTGLHMADVTRLLDCFDTLISVGHSLIVVEHNLRLIRNADWVIDMGPGAADKGGQVVFAGPPEALLENQESVTARFLPT